jgi:uncharacterized coiled-coil DUF342 family protein
MQEWQEKIEQEVGELREEVRKLREQITEPITIPRIELDPGGIQNRLDNHAEILKEISQKQDKFSTDVEELKLDAKAYTGDAAIFKNKVEHVESDIGTLKTDMSTLKSGVEQVKTIQSGHSKYFEEHGKRLAATATKDNISSVRGDISKCEARLDTTATKDDISRLESDITSIKDTQEQILKLLQQKSGE